LNLNSRRLTSSAFGIMLALMVSLVAVGLSSLNAINQSLRKVVMEHDVKMNLVWDMRHSARERAIILHRLVMSDDPFVQDELIQQFHATAGVFIAARDHLLTLPLSVTEQASISLALQLAKLGGTAQEEVVELVVQGKRAMAVELLLSRVASIQNTVLGQLDLMLEHQRSAAQAAELQANGAYGSAAYLMLSIGAAVLFIGLAIAIYVTRRTARIEADLIAEKLRAQLILHSIGDAIVTTDMLGNVTYLNKIAEDLSGWPRSEAEKKPVGMVLEIFLPDEEKSIFDSFSASQILGSQPEQKIVARLVARNRLESAIEYQISPIQDESGRAIGCVIVLHDVTRSVELSRRLSWAASHDALTGLINRTEFERRLEALLGDARQAQKEHALLYLDLDQFKVVNDTCGHQAGDELLRQLAGKLESMVRTTDTLARLGGDEFGVLLAGCPLPRAEHIADGLREAVTAFRFVWQDKIFDIGVSIGLVPINTDSDNSASLLSTVDAACYAAKEQGRNRVHVFEAGDEELMRRQGEMNWAQRVSQAIKDDRLLLYFQKIMPISAAAGRHHHFELLIRMLDENGKLVPPMAFIPAAERYNMMNVLDRWVVETSFRHLAACATLGDTVCAINLSGQSLGDEHMLDFILEQFGKSGVPPQHVCFEITETAAIANLRSALRLVSTLRAKGCQFSLDDFGSGMSSFGYLKQLQVDYLKIDGSFVRQIMTSQTDRAMVASINNIGHVMGIQTIAECVEDDDMLNAMREIGIDYVQGYHIHYPQPLAGLDFLQAPHLPGHPWLQP
jgi:diguanylate cyclase (GGDEF)-like protein/PAS domain S-box-containing protein